MEDFRTEADRRDEAAQSETSELQSFLFAWQWPVAFGPFVVLIALAQFPISNAIPAGLFVGLVITAVTWAVAFKGYLLYLTYQK